MIDPQLLAPLIAEAPKRRYRKGALLIQEGDTGSSLYILLSGSVRVFSSNWDDKEITFNVHEAITILGEMSLDGSPRSASVEALETCECAVVDLDLMTRHLSRSSELTMQFVRLVIQRARDATASARNMALLDVYGRVREFLETAPAEIVDGQRVLRGRLTQKDVANRLGASREMISRIFGDLEAGGHLMAKGGVIRVKPNLPRKW